MKRYAPIGWMLVGVLLVFAFLYVYALGFSHGEVSMMQRLFSPSMSYDA